MIFRRYAQAAGSRLDLAGRMCSAALIDVDPRRPGLVLRSKSLELVLQETYGYLLTRHAIWALVCRALRRASTPRGSSSCVRAHGLPPAR